jgi:hypothetical protein
MMKFTSHSREPVQYDSIVWRDSQSIKGVRFAIRRISLLHRLELTKRVREISLRDEFLKAGDNSDQLEASINDLTVRKVIFEWGFAGIAGLRIDEEPATGELLIEKGPEQLCHEIIDAIQAEAGLSEKEIKNF